MLTLMKILWAKNYLSCTGMCFTHPVKCGFIVCWIDLLSFVAADVPKKDVPFLT